MASTAVPSPISPLDEVSQNLTASAAANPEWDLARVLGLVSIEGKLIASALAIIYVGAHGALRRPPSASPPKRKDGKDARKDEEPVIEGLMPSDAITFPIMAGIMLIGLYYLIQWLQDPAILNKILRVYMSVMGVASLTTLMAHSLRVAGGFVFPGWMREGGLWRVDDEREGLVLEGEDEGGASLVKKSPLPAALRRVFPESARKLLWDARHLFVEEWTVRAKVHGLFSEKFSLSVNYIFGFILALATVSAYYMTGSPLLSNVMGYGFCYGALIIMSPTTFATGSLVLIGLFFYDIVMVFYTPYMITVATKLDVPIKLQFQSAARSSILGLGDIVVPGIVMCLALRFDMWLHYQRQIKYVPTDLKSDKQDATSGDVITVSDRQHVAEKVAWVDITGCWGDWFWSSSWLGLFSNDVSKAPPTVRGSTFRKTYFNASLVGYTLGMLATLVVLTIFKHGQPALLYLVPGVLGSLWLTGLVRGELKEMWTYTEDGSLDTRDVVVELDGNGNVIKEIKKDDKEKDKDTKDKEKRETDAAEEERKKKEREGTERDAEKGEYSIVAFSITAPLRKPKSD